MQADDKRIYAVDLARGAAVLFMIGVHVLESFARPEVIHSWFGQIVEFLGEPPAAPMFMCLMGLSFYFSRNTGMSASIRRGFYIIALGYVLNLLRYTLPLGILHTAMPERLQELPPEVTGYLQTFLCLDILQFAGLALILMAILRHYKAGPYLLLLAAAVLAAVSPLLWGLQTGVPVLDRVLDYLWGDLPATEQSVGNWVAFPAFPWLVFPLVGMCLGQLLSASADKPRLFRKFGACGLLILVVSLGIIGPDYEGAIGDYYHTQPAFLLFMTGVVLVLLYLCQLLVERLPDNPVFRLFFYWSRHVNRIYILQWMLIAWGSLLVLGFHQMSTGQTCLMIAGVAVLSHVLNWLLVKLRTR